MNDAPWTAEAQRSDESPRNAASEVLFAFLKLGLTSFVVVLTAAGGVALSGL